MALTPQQRRRQRFNQLLFMQMSMAAYASTKASWTPLELFQNDIVGGWWDPSDLSTMFQDSAGTTPVTAVEQPVGLHLDKSKGLALGAELVTPASGPYASVPAAVTAGSGITLSVVSGATRGTCNAVNSQRLEISFPVVAGRFYKWTANLASNTSIILSAFVNLSPGFPGGVTPGAITYHLQATATGTAIIRIYPRSDSATPGSQTVGDYVEFSSFSVREISGNHRYQSTSAARPTLSARYNFIAASEDASTSWTRVGINPFGSGSVLNATSDSTGATTADFIQADTSTGQHRIDQAITAPAGDFIVRAEIKSNGYTFAALRVNSVGKSFDLSAGAVGSDGTGSGSIQSLGNGWYACTVVVTGVTANPTIRINAMNVDGITTPILGDGVSGVYVARVDVRHSNDGIGLPAYQRVNTSTDYDTSGFPMYLRYDGTDDFMQTASVDFSGTDKVSVFAGVRKLSDAAFSFICELTTSTPTTAGGMALYGSNNPGYGFTTRGSVYVSDAGVISGYASPITNVLTGLGDIAADSKILRINGSQVASNVTDQGTGNLANAALYFGARAGTSLFFNGREYQTIIRGAASTATELAAAESYVNNRTRAY